MYETGKGVSQNYAKAVKWYQEATNQGFALAQSKPGYMYSMG